MPLYEYQCTACAHRFERIVKYSDPVPSCPKCGKDAVEQLISAPAVQFKGSGWYVTDYAKKNSAGSTSPSAHSVESAPSSNSAKSTAAAPAKPAASTAHA